MSLNQDQMLQAIYDTLFSAFTSPPAGAQGQGASQADQTYVTLQWPGLQVDVSQYSNPWSPSNPKGSMAATENLSFLVDKALSINPISAQNGNNVSDVYAEVVTATVTPPPPDPKAEEAYKAALAFLQVQTKEDDGMGGVITVTSDSRVYANYKLKKKAYDNAVISMMANYFQYDMSKPDDQRKWSLLGPTYLDAVTTAWNDWMAAQKSKVESQIAVMSQYSNNQVGTAFAAAQSQFNALRKTSADSSKIYYASYASPANWFSASAAEDWTEVTIDSGNLKTSEKSDYSSMSTGGSAGWGLWSLGGSFSKEDSHQSMDQTTQNLKVKFKFARIDITRPWLNMLLLSMTGWSVTGRARGALSNGTKTQPLGTPFPLLPTSFIAVRDLSITADWGKQDSESVSSKTAAKSSFGWGPFAISGSYASGSESKTFTSDFDGRTITNNGLQIIGWINTVVPNCPPA